MAPGTRNPPAPSGPPARAGGAGGLAGWFATHKTQAYIGGAAAAGGLALLAKRKAAKGSGTTPGTVQAANGATYDSTASDVYNSIEPQLEALQRMFYSLQAVPGSTNPVPAGAGAAGAGLAPSSAGYPAIAASPSAPAPSTPVGYAPGSGYAAAAGLSPTGPGGALQPGAVAVSYTGAPTNSVWSGNPWGRRI
jgi:hypothetical protein